MMTAFHSLKTGQSLTSRLKAAHHILLAFVLMPALSACGFHSMYGDNSNGAMTAQGSSPSVVEQLSYVQMGSVTEDASEKDRQAQLVKNELLDQLDAIGPGTPRYRLDVIVKLESEMVGTRPDEVNTRVNMKLYADYTLTALNTGKTVFVNRAVAFNAYDVVRSDFATLSARQDAMRRLVPEVSNQIMTRLGLYFHDETRKAHPEAEK
jgi:LPS-assembly lipoprotein